MSSANIFVNTEKSLEDLVKHARFMADIDLLLSPIDGKLVVVAQDYGMHVCQTCGKPVSFENGVETKHGYARLLLHPRCVAGRSKKFFTFRSFMDVIRGVQFRRDMAKMAKATENLSKAAEESKTRLVA